MMEGFNLISNLSDSKIRHLVGFLPILSFIFIFGYASIIKILILSLLVILSVLFEFNWTIFNNNKKEAKKVMKKFRGLKKTKKLSQKEQWSFFKNEFHFINFGLFFFTMIFVSLFFIIGMIMNWVHFVLNYNEILGGLSAIYLFTFIYTFLLIIYNKNYGVEDDS